VPGLSRRTCNAEAPGFEFRTFKDWTKIAVAVATRVASRSDRRPVRHRGRRHCPNNRFASRDRTMSKSELLDLVWPGLVVEENNLQVQTSHLRKVFGATAVATIPGRGYRFTLQPDADAGAIPAPAVQTNAEAHTLRSTACRVASGRITSSRATVSSSCTLIRDKCPECW
jgi:hypothetical protein